MYADRAYVAFIYIREKYEYKVKQKEPVFELLLITGILSIDLTGQRHIP